MVNRTNKKGIRWVRQQLYRLYALGGWAESVTNDEMIAELDERRMKIEQDIIEWIEKHTAEKEKEKDGT